jgi:hypothetical protein
MFSSFPFRHDEIPQQRMTPQFFPSNDREKNLKCQTKCFAQKLPANMCSVGNLWQ